METRAACGPSGLTSLRSRRDRWLSNVARRTLDYRVCRAFGSVGSSIYLPNLEYVAFGIMAIANLGAFEVPLVFHGVYRSA